MFGTRYKVTRKAETQNPGKFALHLFRPFGRVSARATGRESVHEVVDLEPVGCTILSKISIHLMAVVVL